MELVECLMRFSRHRKAISADRRKQPRSAASRLEGFESPEEVLLQLPAANVAPLVEVS